MNTTPLSAAPRTEYGKGAARKLRATGRIPALVYRGGNAPTHISVDPKELRLLFQRAENPNAILALEVDGTTHNCLLTATQKHPVSRALLHADFYEVVEGDEVTVSVPVFHVGKARGAVLGGRINYIRRSVPVTCLPADIPAKIDIDVTEMDLGEFLRASGVVLPEGCRIDVDNDFNVLSCKGRKLELELEAEEAAEAEEGEEGGESGESGEGEETE